ncbi:MAG: nucleotidyltransferase domain-containing protein [bacterium]|nr:nucleotidyltransferase domain-containing protein [bacterium]
MPVDYSDDLEQIKKIIIGSSDPRRIILFGSRCRNDAHIGSDIDLLIEASHSFDSNAQRRKEIAALSRALAHIPIDKDILLYSTEEISQHKNSVNHVIGRALREGICLYERRR